MIEVMRCDNLVGSIARIKENGGSFVRVILSDGDTSIIVIDTSMGRFLKKTLKASAWEEVWCEVVEEEARKVFEGELEGDVVISVVPH